jgi:Spy/CpxP family protein refolding chaperone
MKRILTSALALILLIGAADAQPGNKGKQKGKSDHREMNTKGLDLSTEQQSTVRTVNENYRKQVAELKTQNLSEAQMKEKKDALHQQHKADIQAVLNAEQRARIANHKMGQGKGAGVASDKAGRGKKEGFEKGGRGERAGETARELDLSTDQQAKMKTIREGYKTKLDAVRNDAALSSEDKRAKMKELMRAQQAEVKEVLTPEQKSKMKGGRKDAVKRR